MRATLFVLLLVAVGYVGWPYYELLRLDRALVSDNQALLEDLVDLNAVRRSMQAQWDRSGHIQRLLLKESFAKDGHTRFDASIEPYVSLGWLRGLMLQRITSTEGDGLFPGLDFAFFERPLRFMIRYGKLGERPVHLYMNLSIEDKRWRVTAVYPCALIC